MKHLMAATGLLALSLGAAGAQTTSPGSTAPAPTAAPPPAASDAAKPAAAKPAADKSAGDKEWQVAKTAKISLAQAIATAEAKDGGQGETGGRAIDADFEKADGKNPAHYAIKVVYPSGKLVEHGINADTGELYKSENQPIERYFTRLKTSDFQNAKVSLKDALALAERKAGGGKAYEAEVEREGSAVEYKIKVALADRDQEIKVGPDGTARND